MPAYLQSLRDYAAYICPACRGPLSYEPQTTSSANLCCLACSLSYPISGGIPDFLTPVMDRITAPLISRVDRADRGFLKTAAGLYEGRFWYPLVVWLYLGKNATSLADLTQRVKSALNITQGRVLDAACGSATYGRRLASPTREVFGIDISMAMLQKGAEYIQQENVPNTHLARTRVESLPFADAFFDFAVCSGALHLFPDAAAALKEIGRTLKPGARLVGMTFFAGSRGLLQYAWFRERLKKRGTIHVFELPELEYNLQQAGFAHFQPQLMGSGVFFSAEKGKFRDS